MTEITTPEPRPRFSIDLNEPQRAALNALAKEHKITQGEVVEVLLDRAVLDNGLSAALTARREAKVARRAPKKELYKQFKNLTPDQLQAALEAAHKLQQAQ